MLRRDLEADVVVLGAGVAGLSTAYHLMQNSKLRVLVLEQETILGGHASGRNAGMIRQTVADSFIARLAVEGRKALEKASRRSVKNFRFLSNGSLLLSGEDTREILKIREVTRKLGVRTQWISAQEAAARVPLLEGARFSRALFCPTDAILENRPLLENFYAELRKKKTPVLFGVSLLGLEREGDFFLLRLKDRAVRARKIVNAAGAWCAILAEKAGAQKIPLKPYRRHLYLTGKPGFPHRNWPFVWDLGHGFYFRPEGDGLLVSPCDKAAVDRKFLDQRKEKTDRGVRKLLAKKMKLYSKEMSRLEIREEKSGLRTMTPDGRFVIGEDARLGSFYWAAGLGGHGVTTCYSVGKLCSDIILEKKTDAALARAFSPARYI